MDIDLTGKRVLVTGGNSGLGAAIAKAFSAEGACVAINYLVNPEETDTLVKQFVTAGGKALGLMADISDAEAIEAMFEEIDEAWGGIDILVNNAGIDGHAALGWEAEPDAWGKVIDINLKGAFLCARAALKRMVPQKSGVVLNTSSVHEVIAWTGYSAYTASKAGVSMMSKSLAQEAAPHGVRVLCIAPGAIRTPINKAVWSDPETYKDLLTKIPLGRIGEAEDIARMAVVLASDVAGYITGTTVFVDGGMTDYPSFAHGG
ncbi:glucose 1-dehydrogenase (plasmid) [Novosphingobium resinovorum]|uniref:Glucose dehydrogenase n=1 Tax=Novosphingobium resinovorum TaxID=158500 RepID=A0A1D8AF25_9SPHN|nr:MULTISPECIES: glucose 1-dehydrogenase [Sphingomonadaceae]AOR80724.1 glucose dehydrogenase [Novosphingobium resinovorum]EJU13389.1 glucose 1-dehydrogenase [Sphingomonas sp. LH128]MBF7015566.1 glucose 1-dehydrogenase [Novosphingobium sp. HR1a]WJM30241.1 glucose 1-dehydrogenase [Novosphingobium resinovorum]